MAKFEFNAAMVEFKINGVPLPMGWGDVDISIDSQPRAQRPLSWNESFYQYMVEMGWGIKEDNRKVSFDGNIHAMIRAVRFVSSGMFRHTEVRQFLGIDNPLRGDSEYAGGSYNDLMRMFDGLINMAPFEAAKRKLMDSNVIKNILPRLDFSGQRRKRRLSEHDGDWDYTRRWEIAPFATALRAPQAVKRIEVMCHLGVGWTVSPEDYNRFGATAWAISEILESIGIQVKITGVYIATGVDEKRTVNVINTIVIKEFGEYIAPSLVATAFTSVFFRRAGLVMFCAASELFNLKNHDGMGSVVTKDKPIEYREGRIIIGPTVAGDCGKEIEAAIFAATGVAEVVHPEVEIKAKPVEAFDDSIPF